MADPPHTVATHRLLRALVDELARCGMREACTSPGSRNTPIVLSLVREPRLHCFSHIDERCAGFFAVGAAKAGGRPVAVTCTSGTAAAELLPAVTEAHWARVPMILLTADRPSELRDIGAGQAIDQIKLYGDAAKWFCEVELPAQVDAGAMRWVRQLACRAYFTALEGRPGPVHLNLPLREPLVLTEELGPETEFPGRPDGLRWVGRGPLQDWKDDFLSRAVPRRTVIVAGRVEFDERLDGGVAELAERIGAPVLADAMSAARSGSTAIATYDLLLRDPTLARSLAPDCVIRVGDLPTSKPLRTWLAGLDPDVRQILVDPHATWQDPDGVVQEIWAREPVHQLQMLGLSSPPLDPDWLAAWMTADRSASAGLEATMTASPALSEPLVARRLGEWLAPETTLFVAASMPIRDVELYLPARVPLPRVLSNRGANGIDGTISSAFGVAGVGGGPVVLLIGDVALLHDLGGLLAARRLHLELTIVVLNNDGGGIFDFLPVAEFGGDAFAEHISTPHGVPLDRVAALFDLHHVSPRSEAELHAAVNGAVGSGAVTLIEVRTERAANLAVHRRLAERGLAAIDRH